MPHLSIASAIFPAQDLCPSTLPFRITPGSRHESHVVNLDRVCGEAEEGSVAIRPKALATAGVTPERWKRVYAIETFSVRVKTGEV